VSEPTGAALVPNRVMFNFRLSVRRFAKPPRIDGKLADWTDTHRLPDLSGLEDRESHADVYMGWDEFALYFAVVMREKWEEPVCDRERYWTRDGFRIWIDTRDTRDIHRASKYCRQFCFFPDDFTGRQMAVPNAKEDAPIAEPSAFKVAGKRRRDGWQMEVALPASVLGGYDPVEHPRIGFCYYLKDMEVGDQWLTLGGVFPYYQDPSVWASVDLVRE
jgi:hypothetical protein